MSIPLMSNCIPFNLFSIKNTYRTQAIELFGKELAESLQMKDGSWKKLMTSWNIFYKACAIIKNSNNYLSIIPRQIHYNAQSKDGLILQMIRCTRHNPSKREGILITPFGYFNIECKTRKAMYYFIKSFHLTFHTKLCQDRSMGTKYSFTLSPNKEAHLKSLYYLCGSKRIEEIGKYAFTRSQVIAICNIARYHLNKVIEFTILEEISHTPRHVSIGIQTDNARYR